METCHILKEFYTCAAVLLVLSLHLVEGDDPVTGSLNWHRRLPAQLRERARTLESNQEISSMIEKLSKYHSSYIPNLKSSFRWPDLLGHKRAPIFVGRRSSFNQGQQENDVILIGKNVIPETDHVTRYDSDVESSYDDVSNEDVIHSRRKRQAELKLEKQNSVESGKSAISAGGDNGGHSNQQASGPAVADKDLLAKLKETEHQEALLSLIQNILDRDRSQYEDFDDDDDHDLSEEEQNFLFENLYPSEHSASFIRNALSAGALKTLQNKTENDDGEIDKRAPKFVGKRENQMEDGDEGELGTVDKRGPRFVGKREDEMIASLDEELDSFEDFEKRRAPGFVGKRIPPRFVGKRIPPRFVGKRAPPRFVGKRKAPSFIGKRGRAPNFIGKRRAPGFVGKRIIADEEFEEELDELKDKRRAPNFVGKRKAPGFVGKRRVPGFVGKRRAPGFVGKRFGDEEMLKYLNLVQNSEVSDEADKRRVPSFVGKKR